MKIGDLRDIVSDSASMSDHDEDPVWPSVEQPTTWQIETAGKCIDEEFESHYMGGQQLAVFHDWYQNYHGYLASVVCVFGIIANAANIVVLTRRNMVSATNCILTALAVADGLTMAAYLPFALRFYVLYGTTPTPERNSFPAVCFLLFYACFSVVVHTIAIWLTVVLAVFRYVVIRYPRYGADWCSLARSKVAIGLVHLVTLIVCIPNFITMTLTAENSTTPVEDSCNNTVSDVSSHAYPPTMSSTEMTTAESTSESLSSIASDGIIWNVVIKSTTPTESILKSFNFWIQALLVKLVPCVGLTVLSLLLVQTMKEAEARRQNLRAKAKTPHTAVTVQETMKPGPKSSKGQKEEVTVLVGASTSAGQGQGRDRKTNRTTRMLLVVVALFLVTEFPQGVINLLSGVLDDFVEEVYMSLGDLLDILALINNGINFILYCTMSKQFRDTFVHCFRLESTAAALSRCFGRGRRGIDDGSHGNTDRGHLLSPVTKTTDTAEMTRKQAEVVPTKTVIYEVETMSPTMFQAETGEPTGSACSDV